MACPRENSVDAVRSPIHLSYMIPSASGPWRHMTPAAIARVRTKVASAVSAGACFKNRFLGVQMSMMQKPTRFEQV